MMKILMYIMLALVILAFVFGVIAVLVEKKRGKSYTGQGFGR